MYKPKFNHVLVEIDDKDAKWGTDEGNLGGVVYREGTLLSIGLLIPTSEYPNIDLLINAHDDLIAAKGQTVMWNEGHEAGTVFEHDNKKFALIYWWDIIGVKE